MIKFNTFWVRILGIFGAIGGLILFAGDLLFYFDPISNDLKLNMSQSSDLRLILSAITALFATWFYMLGAIHIYYAFKKSTMLVRNIVVMSFLAIFSAYGVVHGAYVAIATSARIASENNLDILATTELASNINNILRYFIYPIFALLAYFFISEVWKRKTYYPRWIILFFPLLPFLFYGSLRANLSGLYWIIFVGGFFNLIIVLFFIASTIALWNSYPVDKKS
jgi:hypothetical protein